jgi:cyclophilin family peptidyl-prolyl cis-trans isomerase
MRKAITFLGLLLTTSMLAACNPSSQSSSSSSSSSSSLSSASSSEQSGTASWIWDGNLVTGKHTAIIATSKGNITVELNADAAPKTVTNFMALAASGYYNGLTFHRVIPGFMIQGGDPTGNGTGGRSIFGTMFEDEIKADGDLYKTGYKTGVLAMANAGPNTNGSQFFIMDHDYPLQPNYTIFGQVTEGQDVVHAIATVDRDPTNDMPKEKVTFSVRVVK